MKTKTGAREPVYLAIGVISTHEIICNALLKVATRHESKLADDVYRLKANVDGNNLVVTFVTDGTSTKVDGYLLMAFSQQTQ
jgi:hypothetical protein